MKCLPLAIAVALIFVASPGWAQKPAPASEVLSPGIVSTSQVPATPEMWFYEQSMRRYQNPQMAVRERAEFRGAQRQSRIASRQWYGISNARPRAGTDPLHSDYGPTWSSGNGYHPMRWSGGAAAVVVARPDAGPRPY